MGNGKTRSLPFWHQQRWPFMERFRAGSKAWRFRPPTEDTTAC